MKSTLVLVACTLLIPAAARAQDGRVNLSFLDRLAERASEKQEVTIGPEMLQATGQALIAPGPKGDTARQIITELRGIYVRSYEFENDKAYSLDDINGIRKQLASPGWTKIVTNEEKGRDGGWELQEVYVFQQGGKPHGIFVINAEPGELQVVNIVGPIDLGKIGALGGMLGIPGGISTGLTR